MKRELTCVACPLGCSITVEYEGTEVISVTGNTCPRGAEYGRKEVTNPTRIVTSSVLLVNAANGAKTVSCKTKTDIPKDKIFDVVKALKGVSVTAPVHIGDVIIEDVAGTGVPIVATKEVL